MSDPPAETTPERLAELDAAYRPPWPLDDWLAAGVPTSLWDTWFDALQQRRSEVSEDQFEEFRRRLVREAAIDTGAIEGLYATDRGFTYTIAELATGWTAALEREKGHDVVRLVEGQLEAYEFALDLASKHTPVSEAAIRHMHELACAGQDTYEVVTSVGPQRHPLPKGSYKEHSNHVLLPDGESHSYAPVAQVADEMHRLVEALADPRFEAAHPAVQAAFAHHSFVVIHPFADGNGRVARVLSSVYLMRSTSLPFALYADERPGYLDAVRAADRRDVGAFARFVADRAVDTTMYLVESLRAATAPSAASSAAALARSLGGPGGLTHQEVDGVAGRLLQLVREEVSSYVTALPLPPGVTAEVHLIDTNVRAAPGYRRVLNGNRSQVQILVTSAPPGSVRIAAILAVWIAKDSAADAMLFRVQSVGSADGLDFRLADLYPQPREAAVRRLRTWVTRVVDTQLAALAETVEKVLRASGYR